MTEIVACHSGSTYAERPMAFTWQGQRFIITEILSRGRTLQGKWFRVRTADDQLFELSLLEGADEPLAENTWQIHQF
jgi:hypothetical protein